MIEKPTTYGRQTLQCDIQADRRSSLVNIPSVVVLHSCRWSGTCHTMSTALFTTLTQPLKPFYGPFSGTTHVSQCQKRTSGLYGTREDEQRQTPTSRLGATPSGLTSSHLHHSHFLQAGCPSCRPTNSVKALKATVYNINTQTSSVCLSHAVKTYMPGAWQLVDSIMFKMGWHCTASAKAADWHQIRPCNNTIFYLN